MHLEAGAENEEYHTPPSIKKIENIAYVCMEISERICRGYYDLGRLGTGMRDFSLWTFLYFDF